MAATKETKIIDLSVIRTVITGFFFAGLGACMAFLFLATAALKPFQSVADFQDYLERIPDRQLLSGAYLKGGVSAGSIWQQKRGALLDGRSTQVELSADEINAWLAATFRQPSSTLKNNEKFGVLILPGLPNCFVDADLGLLINVPIKVAAFGSTNDCLLIIQGHFSLEPQVSFEVESMRVNHAAIPLQAGIGHYVMQMLLRAYSHTDEFVGFEKAWQRIDFVEIDKSVIRMELGR